MKNILSKYIFIILGIVSLVNIPVLGIQVINKGPILTPITISNFKCGAGFAIYKVTSFNSFNQAKGNGMRCVKTTTNIVNQVALAYYGEGYASGCSYRTVGELKFVTTQGVGINAFTRLTGRQADIWGNGECRKINSSISTLSDINFNKLSVFGLPNGDYEEWQKYFQMVYTPMPRITTCGNKLGFNEYKAVDGPNGLTKVGSGVRCVLKITNNTEYTWFGQGNWYGNALHNYTELGTRHPLLGFGSSQIYGGGPTRYGSYALDRTYGSFKMALFAGVTEISLPKDESWLLLGYK